jgi:shikimate dehydrogenase
MMDAAFRASGMEATYEAVSVPRGDFRKTFLALREGARGINLTIPYKSEVIPLLDRLDEISVRIGAVNVVARSGQAYLGFNSDVNGITSPLRHHGRTRVGHALLVGSGGAARAFCEAMSELGCPRVTVAVRNLASGERFAAEMAGIFPTIEFGAVSIGDLGRADADLLFNATPIGSRGLPLPDPLKRVIYGQMTVFDAVYRPMETELMTLAKARGAETIFGYEMLLDQGTRAFEIWTGVGAPREEMRGALLSALEMGD